MAPKSKDGEPPKIVTRRWTITPIDERLDRMLASLPDEATYTRDEIRANVRALVGTVLDELRYAFEKAAGRGIEQAIELAFDPEHFQNRLARRRKERDRELADKHATEAEALRRRRDPTRTEVEQDLARHRAWLASNEQHSDRWRAAIVDLEAKLAEMPPPEFDDDDGYGPWRS